MITGLLVLIFLPYIFIFIDTQVRLWWIIKNDPPPLTRTNTKSYMVRTPEGGIKGGVTKSSQYHRDVVSRAGLDEVYALDNRCGNYRFLVLCIICFIYRADIQLVLTDLGIIG